MKAGNRLIRNGLIAIAAGVLAAGAHAQDVSTARYMGIAAAGLALPIDASVRGAINPALYGFETKRFTFDWPSLGHHLSGVSLGELQKDLGSVGSGALNSNTLTKIARDFGTQNDEFGAAAQFGMGWHNFHLGFGGEANVLTVPNATLIREAKAGTFNDLNDNLDGYGYGYYSVDLGYGHGIPVCARDEGTLYVGARLRLIHSYYAHRFVNGNAIVGNNSATPGFGAEMNGQSTLNKTGLGADLGVDYAFQKHYFAGAVVHNLVQPKVGFASTLPDEQGFGIPGEVNFNPFVRAYDVGFGYEPCAKLALAGDFVDIGNLSNHQELRFGADYTVNRWFNVQAGYGTRNGYAVGIGVSFLNLAIGNRLPFMLNGTFHF